MSLAILCFACTLMLSPFALAQSGIIDRPAKIIGGTCAAPGALVAALANVILTAGDPLGQSGATPVEQSGTVVPFALSDFLAADHAIVVQQSPAASTVVACGEIGGAVNPDGTLGVGLRSVGGSGVSGVAYFTPIDTFENLLVTILLVSDDASGPTTVAADPGVDVAAQTGELDKDAIDSGAQ